VAEKEQRIAAPKLSLVLNEFELEHSIDDEEIITQATVQGRTFDGIEARRVCFRRCKLVGINMTGASIRDTVFTGCSAKYAGFRFATFERAAFEDSNCSSADFEGASFSKMKFSGTDLRQAQMSGAALSGIDLRTCDIDGLGARTNDLKGVVVLPEQAVVVAKLLGVIIKE